MSTIEIPLFGELTSVERKLIPLELIVLDIENPRIQYYLDTRLNDRVTQEEVKLALAESNEQYKKLREHIEVNGGVYNQIWVVPEDGYYRVIEGNTRAYVYSELAEKYANDPKWKSIDAYVLPTAVERHKINFIRLEAHLFGPTPWDAYDKARELYRLHTKEDYPLKRLQQLTKMSAYDIENNIGAFRDMDTQYLPKYGKPGEQLKFSYFAEFRKNKALKALRRQGRLSLEQFCDLVGIGRFGRGEDVRKLAMVWEDEEARNVLLEEDMEAALDQLSVKNPAAKSKLFERIEEVTSRLEEMPLHELVEIKSGFSPAKVKALQKLHKVVSDLLTNIGSAG